MAAIKEYLTDPRPKAYRNVYTAYNMLVDIKNKDNTISESDLEVFKEALTSFDQGSKAAEATGGGAAGSDSSKSTATASTTTDTAPSGGGGATPAATNDTGGSVAEPAAAQPAQAGQHAGQPQAPQQQHPATAFEALSGPGQFFAQFFAGMWAGYQNFNNPLPDVHAVYHDSEARGVMAQMAPQYRRMALESFRSQLESAGLSPGAAESALWIPQMLSTLNNPQMIRLLEAIEPGSGQLIKTLGEFVTGGKGSEADIGRALNTGRYGIDTALDVANSVQEIGKMATITKDNPDPKFTKGQVAATAQFLTKEFGYNFEVASGALEAKNFNDIIYELRNDDFKMMQMDNLYGAYKEAYDEAYKKAHGGALPEEGTPEYDAYREDLDTKFSKALVSDGGFFLKNENTKKDYEEIYQDIVDRSSGDPVKKQQAINELTETTKLMRVVGGTFKSIASPETWEALVKKGGNEYNAEILAAQHVMSIYGGNGLREGNLERAAYQTNYIQNAVRHARLDEKSAQEHAAAMYKAFGPENTELANAAVATAYAIEAHLAEGNKPTSEHMRLKIEQRVQDSVADLSYTRVSWFMNQKLDRYKSPKLYQLQKALKEGKNLDPEQLQMVAEWIQSPEKFNTDLSEATGLDVGEVAMATSAQFSSTIVKNQTQEEVVSAGTAVFRARTMLDNELLYKQQSVDTAVNSAGWTNDALNTLGYKKKEDLVDDISFLGSKGMDEVELLSGSTELTEEQRATLEDAGKKGLIQRIDENRKKYLAAQEQVVKEYKKTHNGEEPSPAELKTLTGKAMGVIQLESTYYGITGETHNSLEATVSETERTASAEMNQQLNREADSTEAMNNTHVEVGMGEAFTYGASEGGQATVQGSVEAKSEAELKAANAKHQAVAESIAGSAAFQAFDAALGAAETAIKNLAEALKGLGTSSSGGTAEQQAPSGGETTTEDLSDTESTATIATTSESTGPTSEAAIATEVNEQEAGGQKSSKKSSKTISIENISEAAAERIGDAVAKGIRKAPAKTNYKSKAS